MLLPPDLKDWLPEDHLVHFVLEVVETMDMGKFKVNERGTGNRQYPPSMMLSLLAYCYATGRFSSRMIERASWEDVAVRYLCAGEHPDHETICKFRRENLKAFEKFFVHILEVASRSQALKKVGTVSVDGTKLKANGFEPQEALTDTGYYSQSEVETLEESGVEAFVAVERQAHGRSLASIHGEEEPAAIETKDASHRQKMKNKLCTEQGPQRYALRKQTVEPVFPDSLCSFPFGGIFDAVLFAPCSG